MAYLDLVAELVGTLPGLSPLLAQKYVNRAYEEIRDSRLWSFLIVEAAVVCPAVVTTGTAAVVQYTDTVTLDAAASAALLAQASPTAVPGLTNMAIRFGTVPAVGQVYSISEADATIPAAIVLTLSRLVVESTDPAASIQVYRPYIVPPIPDFLKWESLVDMTNAFTIAGDRLNKTSKYFDMRDPQRQAQGLAYFLGNFLGSYIPDVTTGVVVPNDNVPAGSNTYELWPHPTSGQTFWAKFRRRGVNFTGPADTQPIGISDNLIILRALAWHAYPFAQANQANFPTFKGVNWMQLILDAKASYRDELRDSKRNDEEAAPQQVWNRGHGLRAGVFDFKGVNDFPVDSNYLQSHLVRF
jgi:hypothetical protein